MRTRDHPPPRPRHLMALPPPVGRRHRAAYSRRSLAGAATLMPSRGFATAVREAAEAVVGPLSALRGASGPDPHRSPPPLSPLSTAAGASWRLGPPPRAIEGRSQDTNKFVACWVGQLLVKAAVVGYA
ncbi:uncharacterized protein LOC110434158 [Sorghum bicolor]|uniref:uncharacterized protein LOC110434158 n=1 Tax=Sorghum bicolor TaxID=4558 RepID=UPI000B426879|nr:uncharacterized protein LOC110434158 [Sorghum bicolor]|eukprot:XP_021313628.1 uncharacterized protein LOC110434158 [Sorghum bicolor]